MFNINLQLFNDNSDNNDNNDNYKFIINTNILLNKNNSIEFNINNNYDFWSGYKYSTLDGYIEIFNNGRLEDKLLGYGFEVELINNNINLPNKAENIYYYKNYNDKQNEIKLEIKSDNIEIASIITLNNDLNKLVQCDLGIKYNIFNELGKKELNLVGSNIIMFNKDEINFLYNDINTCYDNRLGTSINYIYNKDHNKMNNTNKKDIYNFGIFLIN